MGEPERNSTEWPEKTPEWGNIPQTDFDWKIALISDNGSVKWETMETSGEGKDRPFRIETSRENIQIYGTFPGQNGVFRKASYRKEDGKLLEEASVEFNNSRNSHSGFSQVEDKSDNENREDYYIFKLARFDPEKVSKVAVKKSEIYSKVSEHLHEEENITSYSLSEPEIITAEENSYILIRPMKTSNWSKTSNLISNIELDGEFSRPEKLEKNISRKNTSSSSTSEHRDKGLYSIFNEFLSFLIN